MIVVVVSVVVDVVCHPLFTTITAVAKDLINTNFRAFDSDKAGYLTFNQVRAACLVMGEPIEEEDFEEMFNIGDMEHSGQFYYEDVGIMGSALWLNEEDDQNMNDF